MPLHFLSECVLSSTIVFYGIDDCSHNNYETREFEAQQDGLGENFTCFTIRVTKPVDLHNLWDRSRASSQDK